jgi:hypothetical protein
MSIAVLGIHLWNQALADPSFVSQAIVPAFSFYWLSYDS